MSATPTTLAGYGILDPVVLTSGSYANPGWITSLAWSKISGTPTSLGGYGIADAYDKTTSDGRYLPLHGTADNASQLLGSTWAAPGTIGSTTPNTGAFTTLTASGLATFAAGSAVTSVKVTGGGTDDRLRITTGTAGNGVTIDAANAAEGAYAKLIFTASQLSFKPNNGNGFVVNTTNFNTQLPLQFPNLTTLTDDAANILAQRNGTSAQTFRVYNTYTDASNYTRGALAASTTAITLAAESAGTGSANIDVVLSPKGTGAVKSAAAVLSSGATAGIGYATGAGGTVTQATSKSTGVTLNTVCGQITMNAAALAASTTVTFTLTNSAIAATDMVLVSIVSGNTTAATYQVWVESIAGGSIKINVRNVSAGSLSEALVLGFSVFKGVTA